MLTGVSPYRLVCFYESFNGFTQPGSLDLFSGRYGVAKNTVRAGFPWVLIYEWNLSAS